MKKTSKSGSTVFKTLSYLKHYKFLMVVSTLFAAVTAVSGLYIPVLIGKVIDCMAGQNSVNFAYMHKLLLQTAVLTIATSVLQWVMYSINNRIVYRLVRDVRNEAFCKIQKLTLNYIDTHPHGEIVSRVIADADQLADGLLMGLAQLFTGIVTILGTLVFMLILHAGIALVVIVLTPISLFTAKYIAEHTYSFFKKQSETKGEQTAFINEIISNQKTVKAFSHESEAIESFEEINCRLESCSVKATFYSSLTNPTTRFVNSLVYAGVVLSGALISISTGGAGITVGGLSCFLSYANQYTKPFNEISGVISELQNSLACAARIFELIEESSVVSDNGSITLPDKISGRVALENVRFSYNKSVPFITDFNLSVNPGNKIAIVGPTGCGKTTIINLLMRFYEVDNGSIKIDGSDIETISQKSLRKNFGMVLQDTWLKTGTVKENIAYGKPVATDEEIISAAKEAHAHEFIRRLPNGYNTVIGENGGNLSGGQRQLLCIARVMLCLPSMLILDEATSSIDTRTELKIQNAFSKMMVGRTCFIVAHRLSTIREADVILVMKDGKIVEQGNHKSLLKKGGFYYKLYNSQFES